MKLDGRKTLILLGIVCILPVAASYFTFYVIKPQKRANYGELLPPKTLPAAALPTVAGDAFSLARLRGKWVMVQFDRSTCDERCREKLYFMRQVRTAQGKEMGRIERVWLLLDDGKPGAELLRDYAGTHVARLKDPTLLREFPATPDPAANIYLIDPLGNLMMRFPENPDPKRMIKDLERLLKYSQIG